MILKLLVGIADELAGVLEDGVRVLLDLVEAFDDPLQFLEIDSGHVENRGNFGEHLAQVVANTGNGAIEVPGSGVEAVDQFVRVVDQGAGGSRDLLDPVGRVSFHDGIVSQAFAARRACRKRDKHRRQQGV